MLKNEIYIADQLGEVTRGMRTERYHDFGNISKSNSMKASKKRIHVQIIYNLWIIGCSVVEGYNWIRSITTIIELLVMVVR